MIPELPKLRCTVIYYKEKKEMETVYKRVNYLRLKSEACRDGNI